MEGGRCGRGGRVCVWKKVGLGEEREGWWGTEVAEGIGKEGGGAGRRGGGKERLIVCPFVRM